MPREPYLIPAGILILCMDALGSMAHALPSKDAGIGFALCGLACIGLGVLINYVNWI